MPLQTWFVGAIAHGPDGPCLNKALTGSPTCSGSRPTSRFFLRLSGSDPQLTVGHSPKARSRAPAPIVASPEHVGDDWPHDGPHHLAATAAGSHDFARLATPLLAPAMPRSCCYPAVEKAHARHSDWPRGRIWEFNLRSQLRLPHWLAPRANAGAYTTHCFRATSGDDACAESKLTPTYEQ